MCSHRSCPIRGTTRAIGIVALLLALVVPTSAQGATADSGLVRQGHPFEGNSRFDEVPARAMAEGGEITFGQALAKLATQHRIDAALTKLESKPGYAGAYWTPEATLVLLAAEPVPDRMVREIRAASHVPVQVVAAEYSMKELERFQRTVSKVLHSAGLKDYYTAIDPREQLVVAAGTTTSQAKRQAIRKALRKQVPAEVLDLAFSEHRVTRLTTAEDEEGSATTGAAQPTVEAGIEQDPVDRIQDGWRLAARSGEYLGRVTSAIRALFAPDSAG